MLRSSNRMYRKLGDDSTNIPILQIPIVQKLKAYKGLPSVKKLIKLSTFNTYNQGEIILNQSHETFIILMQQGQAQIVQKNNNLQSAHRKHKKQAYSHILVDSQTQQIVFVMKSEIYILSEKYLFEIFQGVMNFPCIEKRLDNLKQNNIFNNLDKKYLVKIAFELEEIKVNINTILQFDYSKKKSVMRRQRMRTEGNNDNQYQNINQEEIIEEKQSFCYYIVEGQIQSLQGKNKPVCLHGQKQLLSNFGNIIQYYAKVKSQKAFVYKINCQLIPSQIKSADYENKRTKWRASRVKDISQVFQKEKSKIKIQNQVKACFLEKQKAFKTVYGHSNDQIKRLEMTCKDGDFKCQNREQFYSKKLDRIMALQKARYGEMDDRIILFPGPLHKKLKNFQPSTTLKDKCKTITTCKKNKSFASSPRIGKKSNQSKRFSTQSNSRTKKLLGSFFATTGTV